MTFWHFYGNLVTTVWALHGGRIAFDAKPHNTQDTASKGTERWHQSGCSVSVVRQRTLGSPAGRQRQQQQQQLSAEEASVAASSTLSPWITARALSTPDTLLCRIRRSIFLFFLVFDFASEGQKVHVRNPVIRLSSHFISDCQSSFFLFFSPSLRFSLALSFHLRQASDSPAWFPAGARAPGVTETHPAATNGLLLAGDLSGWHLCVTTAAAYMRDN